VALTAPIRHLTTFQLSINPLRLSITQSLLLRADEVGE
jgi:hypothetical protein